jgi:threonine dehydratase
MLPRTVLHCLESSLTPSLRRTAWVGTSSWASSSYHLRSFSAKPIQFVVDDTVEEEEKGNKNAKKETSTPSSKAPSSTPPPPSLPCDFSDISRAKMAIKGGVKRTECTKSYFLSELIGANIYLKPENQQFTGSFKERGARNAILQLIRERGDDLKGVIAASAGNHALALAYHGKELGVPVTVVMPVVAPLAKVDKCRKFGANVVIDGNHILESKKTAEELIATNPGLQYVNGFDDPPIIAGAGTIGQEIIEDVPCVDAVVVPVGGAGLIAGVACAVKTLKPDCLVRFEIWFVRLTA